MGDAGESVDPAAVNKIVDALSRTWDPGNVREAECLLNSIQN